MITFSDVLSLATLAAVVANLVVMQRSARISRGLVEEALQGRRMENLVDQPPPASECTGIGADFAGPMGPRVFDGSLALDPDDVLSVSIATDPVTGKMVTFVHFLDGTKAQATENAGKVVMLHLPKAEPPAA